jgi:hypothetical protein
MQEWSGYGFARTPQSGGLQWKKQHTSGDIVCIDERHGPRFPFSIECKFHEDLDLLHLIDDTIGKKSNKITAFWEQTQKDAATSKKLPLLFMRRNGMKAGMHFVVMQTNFWLLLLSANEPWLVKYGIFHFTSPDHVFTIMNSEDLVNSDYKTFNRLGKKVLRNVPT